MRERLVVKGEDDLARLATSFNQMATNLQRQIRQLEELEPGPAPVRLGRLPRAAHPADDGAHGRGRPARRPRATSTPVSARAAELLQVELDRFETLLVDLLEISRFDAGAAVLDLDDVNLSDVAHRIVDSTMPLAAQRGVRLVVRAPHDRPCLAEADVRRVERILRNLVTNAIDHAAPEVPGGRAEVVVHVAGDQHSAAVAVRDHGVGLAPGESAMVFNRFWRADPARARTSGGTGLGLSIALEDTHLHGGWLQAWGRPGEGAQFRLTLPRRVGEPLRRSPITLIPDDAEEPV